MNIWPPELLSEYHQVLFGNHLHREFIDRQIESHPWRSAKHRGKAKRCWNPLICAPAFQQHLFHRNYCFCIERNGAQFRVLVNEFGGILHLSVVAARRSEYKALDSCFPALLDHCHRRFKIHGLCQLWLTGAGRVAHNSSQMNHRVTIGYSLVPLLGVANVAVDKLEIWIRPNSKQRFTAIGQPIEDAHLVTCTEQKGSQARSNVTCSAGDKDPHFIVLLSKPVPAPSYSLRVFPHRSNTP